MLVIGVRARQHRALMQIDLTPRELAMLDFEREWWRCEGRKEDQIRERFGLSPSSYYRALQGLIEMDAACAYDPLTVKRLRRQRDQRRRVRLEGRRADPGSR
jgi:DNA-binding MarR family transcriptional regulator